MVLTGLVDGKQTLALAFRGTDEGFFDEFESYNFSSTYSFFSPLISRVKAYASEHSMNVLITGHSMGAALAQTALVKDFTGGKATAYDFAQPGSISSDAANLQMAFNRADDLVGGGGGYIGYKTSGTIITLDSPTPDKGLFAAHAKELYQRDIDNLARAAADVSKLGFINEPLAIALKNNQIYQNVDGLRIGLGTTGADVLKNPKGMNDNYILGLAGDDMIFQDSVSATRLVDGGSGTDYVVFDSSLSLKSTAIVNGYELSIGSQSVGSYFGVEYIITPLGIFQIDGTVQFSFSFSVPGGGLIPLRSSTSSDLAVPSQIAGFKIVTGEQGQDAITGTDGADLAYTWATDSITTGDGNDIIFVNPDDPLALGRQTLIDGGTGADIMVGGQEDDTFIVDDTSDAVSDAGGRDLVRSSVSFTLPEGTEELVLTGARGLTGQGNNAENRITGTQSADWLDSKDGDDVLDGGDGNDILIGGEGADRLQGGLGSDTVSYHAESAAAVVNLAASWKNAGSAAGDSFSSIENLTGSSMGDRLTGDATANIIVGGVGRDILYGGAGADIFKFRAGDSGIYSANRDGVMDFQNGIDKIDLSGLAAFEINPMGDKAQLRIDAEGDGIYEMQIAVKFAQGSDYAGFGADDLLVL